MAALAVLALLVVMLPLHGAQGGAVEVTTKQATATAGIPAAAVATSAVQTAGWTSRRLAQNGSKPTAVPGSDNQAQLKPKPAVAAVTKAKATIPNPAAAAAKTTAAAAAAAAQGPAAPAAKTTSGAKGPKAPAAKTAAAAQGPKAPAATTAAAAEGPKAPAAKTTAAGKVPPKAPAAQAKGTPGVKLPPAQPPQPKKGTGSTPRNATIAEGAPSMAAAVSKPAPVSVARPTTAAVQLPTTAAAASAAAAAASAAAAAAQAAAATAAAATAQAAAATAVAAATAAMTAGGTPAAKLAATTAAPAINQQQQEKVPGVQLPAASERGTVLTPVTPVGPDPASTKRYAPLTRQGQQFVFYLQPPYAKYPDCMLEGVSAYFLHWKTPEATVRSVRAAGGLPVCYITIGSWEPGAKDAAEFLPGDLGRNFTQYAGQRYLNVRSANVRRLMVKRIEWCYQRGFVGMHFDGTDLYTGDFYPAWKHEQTGHNLTETDMVDYLRFLSKEVHARDMGWGLLNSQMLIKYLGDIADWYTNEACFTFMGDCKLYEPVTKVGRPVYQINYTPENMKEACSTKGLAMNFTSILTSRWLHGCPWESCEKKLC